MSTPENDVKVAVQTETKTLETRITALEAQAKSWYEKHLPLLAGVAGLVVGSLTGHFIR
jgi:hypothetical protein